MFETLPAVIPTLRDVARGMLRPAASVGDSANQVTGDTATVLLDAAPDLPALTALYDELELYLQAAHISGLRLRPRGSRTVEKLLDILASVTLLRSRGH